MYGEFASVYDELMSDYDYDAWADFLIKMTDGGVGIEFGCGTGSITLRLSKAGRRMTGVDISEQMLSIAAAKAKAAGEDILFLRGDMTCFSAPKKYSFAVIPCDGLNYVKNPAACFRSVAACLEPGGTLVFDISTRHKLEKLVAGNTFFIERENCSCVWQNAKAGGKIHVLLTVFERGREGFYRKKQEGQTMYIHSEESIIKAAEESGLVIKEVLDCDFGSETTAGMRKHFVAALKNNAHRMLPNL